MASLVIFCKILFGIFWILRVKLSPYSISHQHMEFETKCFTFICLECSIKLFIITHNEVWARLWGIYIRAKANMKATSLLICFIVSIMCVYSTVMCERQKIKEKNRFCFHIHSNINAPLWFHRHVWFCSQGGVCLSAYWDATHTPLEADTPRVDTPKKQTPPRRRDPPKKQTPPPPREDTPKKQTPPKEAYTLPRSRHPPKKQISPQEADTPPQKQTPQEADTPQESDTPPRSRHPPNAANARAVRILLECNLV